MADRVRGIRYCRPEKTPPTASSRQAGRRSRRIRLQGHPATGGGRELRTAKSPHLQSECDTGKLFAYQIDAGDNGYAEKSPCSEARSSVNLNKKDYP